MSELDIEVEVDLTLITDAVEVTVDDEENIVVEVAGEGLLTGYVSSFNSRSGAVMPASGDYTASQITNVPAGTIAATTVQAAIDELSGDITVLREILTAARTYYIRVDGDDNNTGLTDDAAGAFLTIQGAWNAFVNAVDTGGQTVTFQIRGPNTYTAGLSITSGWTGGGAVIIQGDSGAPTSIHVSVTSGYGFVNSATLPGTLTIRHMKITASGSAIDCIRNDGRGNINVNNVTFVPIQFAFTATNNGATVTMGSGVVIDVASCIGMSYVQSNGLVFIRGIAINFAQATAFSASSVYATTGGTIVANSATFTGSAGSCTGPRYTANFGGQIFTQGTNSGLGTGANFFPGNVAGTPAYGSINLADGALVA